MGKQAIRLKIEGTVQGVFFRQSTQEKAGELNICGWVRNTDDGCVEVFAEGDAEAINQLVIWCHRGPMQANVRHVQIKDGEVQNYSGFEIRR